MKLEKLLGYTAHAEYLGKPLSEMSRSDVQHRGEYLGDIDQLKQDIKLNGIQKPLVIREDESGERYLRNGHHRLVVAMELQLEYVPVEVER
jgi:ParB-like chromosome segregation protein Spo0J